MVRLKDGFTVLWREQGAVQIGTDPRCGVVLQGLSDDEQALLDLLPDHPLLDDLVRAGRGRQIGEQRVRDLVTTLVEAGVLLPDGVGRMDRPGPRHPAAGRIADVAYWARLRHDGDGRAVLERRSTQCVGVLGVDRLGMLVASGLAAAGVGTVLLSDPAPVLPADVAPGAFAPADVGRPREEAGAAALRAAVAGVRTSARGAARPDVCVLVEHGVASPVLARPLVQEDLVHLSVVVRDVDVVVGPLVAPGHGPCLRCLDLHRCDADERWPAIATQVAACPAPGVETLVGMLAAALAVGQVLAHLDGRWPVVRSGTLEVTAVEAVPRLRIWASHPDCGCRGLGARDGVVAEGDRSDEVATVEGTAGPAEPEGAAEQVLIGREAAVPGGGDAS
jgi:hypothetical protein